jgi:hypothetical protein
VRRLPLLIIAALAASAAALALAVGGSAQGPHTIQLVERAVQATEIHTPPRRFSQGDAFVFRSTLRDTSGQPAGHDGVYCVFTKATRRNPVVECSATLFLRDGKITVSGGANLGRRRQLFPVVGGTGAYEGAQGTLLTVDRGGGRSDLTINLRP